MLSGTYTTVGLSPVPKFFPCKKISNDWLRLNMMMMIIIVIIIIMIIVIYKKN